jgi:hypothetical protein
MLTIAPEKVRGQPTASDQLDDNMVRGTTGPNNLNAVLSFAIGR